MKGPAVVTVVLAGMGLAGQAVADPTPLQGVARFHGTADNDYLTYSMAGGGDVDGDGYDDLALGATGSDVGGSSRGAVYLFLGSEDGWAGDVDAATADAWWYGVGMNLGTAVAVAPDVNGDGIHDVVTVSGWTNSIHVHLGGGSGGWEHYCTAKLNSLGCLPRIWGTGTPSTVNARPFWIQVENVENQTPGIWIYQVNGTQTSIPFKGGKL